MGPYAHALALGTDLSPQEKQSVAEKLHGYIGLPVAYWLKANLRVNGGEFEKDAAGRREPDHRSPRLRATPGPHMEPL